jgi:hypothetical protein
MSQWEKEGGGGQEEAPSTPDAPEGDDGGQDGGGATEGGQEGGGESGDTGDAPA